MVIICYFENNLEYLKIYESQTADAICTQLILPYSFQEPEEMSFEEARFTDTYQKRGKKQKKKKAMTKKEKDEIQFLKET